MRTIKEFELRTGSRISEVMHTALHSVMRLMVVAVAVFALVGVAIPESLYGDDLRQTREHLARLHDNVWAESLTVSPDGRRVAFIEAADGDRMRLVLDGVKSRDFDYVAPDRLFFSQDSEQFLYMAVDSGEVHIIFNGELIGKHSLEVDGDIRFNRDWSSYLLLLPQGNALKLIRDGTVLGEYENVDHGSVVVSQNLERYALCMEKADDEGSVSHFVVVDGVKAGPYQEVQFNEIVFSPDGERYAYVARTSADEDAWDLYVDGEIVETAGVPAQVDFAKDGRLLVVAVKPTEVGLFVEGGRVGGSYDSLSLSEGFIKSLSTSERLAFIAVKDGRVFLVVDGREYGPFDGFAPNMFTFTADGSALIAVVQTGERIAVLVNGERVASFDSLPWDHEDRPLFAIAPEGAGFAVAGITDDQTRVVVNGEVVGDYPAIGRDDFLFSADGRRFGFIAYDTDARAQVIIDGDSAGTFAAAGALLFTDPDNHPAFLLQESDQIKLFVDGLTSEPLNLIQDVALDPEDRSRILALALEGNGDLVRLSLRGK